MKWFAAGALALAATAASAGTPYPKKHMLPAQDLGRLARVPGAEQTVTATVALSLDTAKMERAMGELYDRQGAQYRKFLSGDEFRARFAPSTAAIARVTGDLRNEGLSVESINGTLLRVTGTPAQLEKAFGVELHAFQIANESGAGVTRFHAPTAAPQLRSTWNGAVDSVLGLDSRPRFHPHRVVHAVKALKKKSSAPNTPDQPGLWTVSDFAQYYDATPLYKSGYNGRGATIGIVTLANFPPSDALGYWASLGLNANSKRLVIKSIDGGGAIPPSDDAGSDETTLDVEQSGGVAPGATVVVYVAPNTDQGFVDAFAQAVADNRADTLSTSWGEWEEFVTGTPVNDPANPRRSIDEVKAFHNIFLQAALQGQSAFAAAGDDGSYDANDPNSFDLPDYSEVLSVDHPACDSAITAAGGTTLPGEQDFTDANGKVIFSVNLKEERAWSWDYLNPLCAQLGYDPIGCGIFPAGGGGGVSVLFPVPDYQKYLDGIATSAPKQALYDETQSPPQLLLQMPARYAGRNLPDISFNADPYTGYIVPYTSDQDGPEVEEYIGGTSFVAPQLAGVTALVDSYAGGRVGLLNYPLYELATYGALYSGRNPAARDITKGDNEYYKAGPGYDQASGLGVLDIANFAAWFR